MRRMIDAGIEIHAQVVLCPEINDGEILERTIRDLAADYPTVRSVAVVPLGLTRYNTDARLTPVTPEFCRRTIQQLKRLQRELHATLGTNFAFLGDEFYLRAGLPVPSRRHYGDYPQIEDGVGMVRSFHEDFRRLWRKLERRPPAQPEKLHGTILTGQLFAPILADLIERLNERFGTRLRVVAVANDYFGPDIVVAGLMTGRDVLAARPQIKGNFVILPSVAFKSDEPVMLDGTTHEELQRQLGRPVRALDFEGLARMVEGDKGGNNYMEKW
jgi:putative radical SAM enzyme (TIGR03279 family)